MPTKTKRNYTKRTIDERLEFLQSRLEHIESRKAKILSKESKVLETIQKLKDKKAKLETSATAGATVPPDGSIENIGR